MKKLKVLGIILVLLILQSCVMKSLNHFYVKEAISYNPNLIGEWTDSKKGQWKIVSFKEEFEKENHDQTNLMKEDREAYEKYKEGYVISYIKSDKEAYFIAVPFKVNDNIYIDFTPFYYDDDSLNGLLSQHLVKTHSVAKLNIKDNELNFSFLSEEVMQVMFNENKIRLEHTKTGIDDNLLLTASPQELYSFIKKFDKLEMENKWRSSDIYNLKKADVQP